MTEEQENMVWDAIKVLKAEPCEDAVSREAVLDGVDRYIYKAQSAGTQDDFYSFAELVVKALPRVTPKPRTGKWIKVVTEKDHYREVYHFECSECGDNGRGLTRFCPNCGAKMEGGSK